jgi:hypothetical protein
VNQASCDAARDVSEALVFLGSHDVALRVAFAFERQTLKPVFSLDRL